MARTPTPLVSTYSIAGCDLDTKQWGVAVQSKFLAVGSVVPWAEPGAGALATQAYANPRYGPDGLSLLRQGLAADEVVERLVAADDDRDQRQLGVVDAKGRSAAWTGPACLEWAGQRTGRAFAAQGNILLGPETVDALATSFEANPRLPLGRRLLECLAAAQAAGGDRRGQQSAALYLVQPNGGYGQLSDVVADLRVDDHERPIEELRRLYAAHQRLYGATPDEDWLEVDEKLGAEMRDRLARLGYEGDPAVALAQWAGVENLEERVHGGSRVDPVVLEALREASG